MDTDKNKDLMRRWIAFANAGFAGSFDEFIAADYVGHLGATAMDRSELERLERQFCLAFPDAHHTVDDLIGKATEWFFERQRVLGKAWRAAPLSPRVFRRICTGKENSRRFAKLGVGDKGLGTKYEGR